MNTVELAGEWFDWSHAESIAAIGEQEWDLCADHHPLVRHGFFSALESSNSLGFDRGAVQGYLALRDGGGVLAACVPTTLKWGNLREFGPEISWLHHGFADGCFAWPKLQACSPYFPQAAPKILVHPRWQSAAFRSDLIRLLVGLGLATPGISAFNLMHIPADAARECAAQGAQISQELSSVWTNPGVSRFEDYVAWLPNRKRYRLHKERSTSDALGFTFAVRAGADISPRLIDDFYRGWENTCQGHGGAPWLPPDLFAALGERMPDAVRLFTAHDGSRYVAGVFCFQSRDTLYLQTWGAVENVPGLCFEMLCYRAMEYAVGQGLTRIDAGLSIPYKTGRGYADEPVFNAHWFYNDRLAELARSFLPPGPASEGQRLIQVG